MTNYDELLKQWGHDRLVAAGHKVDKTANVRVDFETRWSGGCETCGYDEGILVVSYGRHSLEFDQYSVVSLLAEIMEYAVNATEK